MTPLTKCLLLPIDGTEEALRPVELLRRLYSDPSLVTIILCYFAPQLPPAYRGELNFPDQLKKKQELMKSREQGTRSALDQARKALAKAGFSSHTTEEYILEKQTSKAKDACLLADRKKVDAVLVQKRVTSSLEGFLMADPTHELLRHCMANPLWLVEGTVEISRAAICISNESASLRAADHAAFMLAGTNTRVVLLHAARTISEPTSSPATHTIAALEKWLMTPEGRQMRPFLEESDAILKREGIADASIQFTVIPSQGRAAQEILDYCRKEDIGIIVLGHTQPTGIKGFLKGSVTKKILAELKNMTVWVVQ